MILKEVPYFERPREKMQEEGIDALTNIDLIAILLRTGCKDENVLEISKKVIYLLEDISDFSNITIQELTNIKGIGPSKAITIVAAVELGKRIASQKIKKLSFCNPEEIFNYFYPRFKGVLQENLYAIYLDCKGKVVANKLLTKGTVNQTLIDPKEVFKWAYKFSSSSIILVHNHPSGDPQPSMADLKMTSEIVKQAKVIDFQIVDHIIIGESFFSMRRSTKNYKVF